MAKSNTTAAIEQAAEDVNPTDTVDQESPVEQAAEVVTAKPAKGMIRVRVVKQVEGKKIGDEFDCYPHEYRLQIKHKSIEII
jgi:hypothetical protein